MSQMRTLGDVIMAVAVLALLWVAYVAGYDVNDRPLREIFRPVEWPMRRPPASQVLCRALTVDSPPPALPGPRSRLGATPLRVTARWTGPVPGMSP